MSVSTAIAEARSGHIHQTTALGPSTGIHGEALTGSPCYLGVSSIAPPQTGTLRSSRGGWIAYAVGIHGRLTAACSWRITAPVRNSVHSFNPLPVPMRAA